MIKRISLLSFFLPLICTIKVYAQKASAPKPYGPLPNQQQLDWQENNIYAFIHFGINTFTDKEWGYGDEDPKLFNPTDFDANQIVKSIQQGGFKGIILTCKHHDGFCLWPTKTTEHNISKSPFRNGKGDLVKEIADACKKYGLKFGVYVSPWDRNAANYGTQDYVKMYRQQITELLTNYGPIFEIWHDGANGGDGYYGGARERRNIDRTTYYNWPSIWQMERKLQPNALIFGDIGADLRWVGTEQGYAGDPCWQTFTPVSSIPGKAPSNGTIDSRFSINGTRDGKYWMPAEVDFSIRPGWFWHQSQNNKVKTGIQLWNHYFLSAGRGASMLLNIPPDKEGRIYPTDSVSILQFGEILKNTFKTNLAKGAKAKASNVRGNDKKHFGTKNLFDNDQFSYWATDDIIHTPSVTISLPNAKTFDIIQLKENTKLGQRIDSIAIDIWKDNEWTYLTGASSIGSNRLIRLKNKVTAKKLRLRVIKSPVCIALSDFGLFSQPDLSKYTTILANANYINKSEWKIIGVDNAQNIIDNKPNSFWQSSSTTFPQSLVIDLGSPTNIYSLSYLPRQDGNSEGNIDRYAVYTSLDNKVWKKVAEGEFANIKANPILQNISIKTTKTRYVKLEALHTVDNNPPNIAEIGIK